MVVTTIISNPQTRIKDTYACSPTVGITVRANGEEATSIINSNGVDVQLAGITPPSDPPNLNLTAVGSGNLTNNTYVAYVYVWAATVAYPFVNSTLSINGSLAPRSNPSPNAAIHITGGASNVNVTVFNTTRTDITEIWIFRTEYFTTSTEAQTAAAAGQAFYIGKVTNNTAGGSQIYLDNNAFTGIDQVEEDNYVAPTFQFAVYYDPYWWGFGNFTFTANATWAVSSGQTIITIFSPDKWYDGRNGQNLSLSTITTGGFNGMGQFKFLYVSPTTCVATLDGTLGTVQNIGAGSGVITIQGPAVTLYRSKPRNPLAWGFTEAIGSALVPQEYAFLVGGGLGTALAVIPNTGLLKLDTEYPTKCYTLNLRLAGSSSFEQSLRIISELYSVSSHWSQFQATTQQGLATLWGIDYKNYAILQCNGATQYPVSGPIPVILRRLTQNRSKQLSCHGIYDARTEMNCIWVTTNDAISQVNYLIYQHAPTGFWGFMDEKDLLCSASIQDTTTGENKTFVGTQTGFFGTAFVANLFNNWLPSTGTYTGNIASATTTSITIDVSVGSFNIVDIGIIGNWCLITDPDHGSEQWARISAVTAQTLTFNAIYPFLGGATSSFDPIPIAGSFFYIGMIECLLEKRYDLEIPTVLKTISEFWATQTHVDNPLILRFFRELRETPDIQFTIDENLYLDTTESDTWVSRIKAPNLPAYSFGVQIIQRGYLNYKLVNFLFKTKDANN